MNGELDLMETWKNLIYRDTEKVTWLTLTKYSTTINIR